MTTTAGTATPDGVGSGGFVHLHVHTEHSKQDGLARIKDLVRKVAASGQTAVAMTDHGTLGGAWKFHKACTEAGVKPILGVEAYLALVPDGSDPDAPALAWDDEQVRFARTFRMEPDAESGKVKRNTNNHLTLLARTETGWRNLCRVMNAAQQSVYYKPLIDYALLKQHSEGLIVLTGCLGGPVASRVSMARTDVTHDDGTTGTMWDEKVLDEARANLGHLAECVGAENVYVELMEHGLKAEGREHIRKLTELADEAGVKVVATNDSHFVDCDEHEHHDEWLVAGEWARGNKVSLDDPDRWRFNGHGFHLKTEAEMRSIYAGRRWQEACDNTVELAVRIDDNVLPVTGLRIPVFPVPDADVSVWEAGGPCESVVRDRPVPARRVGGKVFPSPSAMVLHQRVLAGAKRKYGASFSDELKARLRFEEDVVFTMGLPDYFLIVADAVDWARSDRGYPTPEYPLGEPGCKKPIQVGPGRGSAAGSAIAYCLDITRVEPLSNGLLFERFLATDRLEMPDIDVDFEQARRDEVYLYLGYRYGHDKVARIGAFQGMKSKRAVKDAARIHGFPAKFGDNLASLIPKDGAEPMPFARIFEEILDPDTGLPVPCPQAQEFREFVAGNDDAVKVLATARAFENVVAGEGLHAAGVIVSDEPLDGLIPLRWQKAKGSDDVFPIALWDGVDIDSFGMLKLDALGLVNLDYMTACLDNIEATTGVRLDPYVDIPHPDTVGDPKVDKAFALIRAGRTQSVFQLASSGITELCRNVAPTGFEDLSAILALYRPGPMGANMHNIYADRKNGREQVDYNIFTFDPAEQAVIKQSLADTFGAVVYQESLMDLGYRVAGFDAPQRNLLRKAVSKKKADMVAKARTAFMAQGVVEMTLPDGTRKPAFRPETLETLWVTFEASAKYLFNKSHTIAYGYLSYLTAYLKANYPTEYAAAVLAVETKDERRLAIIADALDEGITVLPPDVNRSAVKTMPDPHDLHAVRFGLGEIRDVKSNAETIVAHRGDQPYTSLGDLLVRTRDEEGRLGVTATAVEGLVEAGALDSFGPRLGHMTVARAVGFAPDLQVPSAEWGALEKANRQRHRLGFTVGEHPTVTYKDVIEERKGAVTEDFDTGEDCSTFQRVTVDEAVNAPTHRATVLGLLTGWSERITRSGGRMANFTMEGERTRLEGVVFPSTYQRLVRAGSVPSPGTLVALSGSLRIAQVFNRDDEDETEEEERVELYADHAARLDVVNVPAYAETRSLVKWCADNDEKPFDYMHKVKLARFLVDQPPAPVTPPPPPPTRLDVAKRAKEPKAAAAVEEAPDTGVVATVTVLASRPRVRFDSTTSSNDGVILVDAADDCQALTVDSFDRFTDDIRARYFKDSAGFDDALPPRTLPTYAHRLRNKGRVVALRVRSLCTDAPGHRPSDLHEDSTDFDCQHKECPPRFVYLLVNTEHNNELCGPKNPNPAIRLLARTIEQIDEDQWTSCSTLLKVGQDKNPRRFWFHAFTGDEVDAAIAENKADQTLLVQS